jgi:hypothetical protein
MSDHTFENPLRDYLVGQTRRQFFASAGVSAGSIALSGLLGQSAKAAPGESKNYGSEVHPSIPGLPHFPAKAKRIIYLHWNGAPSQLDTWDYKPDLHKHFGIDLPESVRNGQRLTTMTSGQAKFPVAPSKFKFSQMGKSGTWVSELLPHIGTQVDKIALMRTVFTNAINHDPACTFVMTGSEIPGKASLGSWLAYGLGSQCEDLPAFVVLTPTWSSKANAQALFTRMWSAGYLPGKFTGVALRGQGDPVLYIQNPDGVARDDRRRMLDALNKINQANYERYSDPDTLTRIAQYEMAFRMQASVPDLTDFSKPGTYAASCLLARRLAERNVRAIQILHRGWDQHNNLPSEIGLQCKDVDQPTAALLKDLERRGLLEDTLVVCGGEFGRTVYSQGALTKDNYGRDHHPKNFCMWMAGAGIKGGTVYGETDDFSYNIAKNPVNLNALNATVLQQMGIDHRRFVFPFQGLDQRLTGVEPSEVIKGILA